VAVDLAIYVHRESGPIMMMTIEIRSDNLLPLIGIFEACDWSYNIYLCTFAVSLYSVFFFHKKFTKMKTWLVILKWLTFLSDKVSKEWNMTSKAWKATFMDLRKARIMDEQTPVMVTVRFCYVLLQPFVQRTFVWLCVRCRRIGLSARVGAWSRNE